MLQKRDNSENRREKQNRDSEAPKRKGRKEKDPDDEGLGVKPSGKVSLFDFLEDKLPNSGDKEQSSRPMNNSYEDRGDRSYNKDRNNSAKFNSRMQSSRYENPRNKPDNRGQFPANNRDDRKFGNQTEKPPRFQRKFEDKNSPQFPGNNYNNYNNPSQNQFNRQDFNSSHSKSQLNYRSTMNDNTMNNLVDATATMNLMGSQNHPRSTNNHHSQQSHNRNYHPEGYGQAQKGYHNQNYGQGLNHGSNQSHGTNKNHNFNQSHGFNQNHGSNQTQGSNQSHSFNQSQGAKSPGSNQSHGFNQSQNAHKTHSPNQSHGSTQSYGSNLNHGGNQSHGVNHSHSPNQGSGSNQSQGSSLSHGANQNHGSNSGPNQNNGQNAHDMGYRRDDQKYQQQQDPYRQNQQNGYMDQQNALYQQNVNYMGGQGYGARQYGYGNRPQEYHATRPGGAPFMAGSLLGFQNAAVNEQARAMLGVSEINWKIGDRCLALYWEDNNVSFFFFTS